MAIDEIENRCDFTNGDLQKASEYLAAEIAWLQHARMELNELAISENKKSKVSA